MRRPNTSTAALALAGLALFVSLGGPAWAASLLRNNSVTSAKIAPGAVHATDIATGAVKNAKLGNASVGTQKLRDGSVTTTKLGDNAVTTTKLGDNAVTSGKVADASLTAGDVAPNTFLPFTGTAADSLRLGGVAASGYVRGVNAQTGGARLVVPDGGARAFLVSIGVGFLSGACTGNIPTLSFEPNFNNPNFLVSAQSGVNISRVESANGLTPGTHFDVTPAAPGFPQVATFQIGSTSSGSDHVATAVATGQHVGTSCVFTGQGVSTG